jgi:hypothetical protein
MYTDACLAQKNLKSFGFNIQKCKVLIKHRKFLKYAHSRASGGRVVRRVTFESRRWSILILHGPFHIKPDAFAKQITNSHFEALYYNMGLERKFAKPLDNY